MGAERNGSDSNNHFLGGSQVTTAVAPRGQTFARTVFSDRPIRVDVTVWWVITPPLHSPSHLWWFSSQPEWRPVRFRVIIVRHKRSDWQRARVDLAYPLDALPADMGKRDLIRLRQALGEAVKQALPEWEIADWKYDRIDT